MDKLELSLDATGVIGLVNGSEELTDLAALQTRAPDAPAKALAQVASALGKPGYDAILDPAAYEAMTRARLANEDANMPWQPGVMRIRDFGLPDFNSIQPPARDGDTLTYFARDTHTGLPCKVVLTLGAASEMSITPLPLTPMDGDPVPVPQDVSDAALGPKKPTTVRFKDDEDDDSEDEDEDEEN